MANDAHKTIYDVALTDILRGSWVADDPDAILVMNAIDSELQILAGHIETVNHIGRLAIPVVDEEITLVGTGGVSDPGKAILTYGPIVRPVWGNSERDWQGDIYTEGVDFTVGRDTKIVVRIPGGAIPSPTSTVYMRYDYTKIDHDVADKLARQWHVLYYHDDWHISQKVMAIVFGVWNNAISGTIAGIWNMLWDMGYRNFEVLEFKDKGQRIIDNGGWAFVDPAEAPWRRFDEPGLIFYDESFYIPLVPPGMTHWAHFAVIIDASEIPADRVIYDPNNPGVVLENTWLVELQSGVEATKRAVCQAFYSVVIRGRAKMTIRATATIGQKGYIMAFDVPLSKSYELAAAYFKDIITAGGPAVIAIGTGGVNPATGVIREPLPADTGLQTWLADMTVISVLNPTGKAVVVTGRIPAPAHLGVKINEFAIVDDSGNYLSIHVEDLPPKANVIVPIELILDLQQYIDI